MTNIYKLTTESHWGKKEEKYYTSMKKVNQQITSFEAKIAEREEAWKNKKSYGWDIVDRWWIEKIEVL